MSFRPFQGKFSLVPPSINCIPSYSHGENTTGKLQLALTAVDIGISVIYFVLSNKLALTSLDDAIYTVPFCKSTIEIINGIFI